MLIKRALEMLRVGESNADWGLVRQAMGMLDASLVWDDRRVPDMPPQWELACLENAYTGAIQHGKVVGQRQPEIINGGKPCIV